MYILRIEHSVPDYGAWKRTFDNDPLGRRQSGVRRYRVLCLADDPNHIMIDLEFDREEEAHAFQSKLQGMWPGARERGLINAPELRTARVLESAEY